MENDKVTETRLHYLFDKDNYEYFVCGLALDYCVFYSACDAKNLGF